MLSTQSMRAARAAADGRRGAAHRLVVAGIASAVIGFAIPLHGPLLSHGDGLPVGIDAGGGDPNRQVFQIVDDPSGAAVLWHVGDHGIEGVNATERLADVAERAGVVLMALGAVAFLRALRKRRSALLPLALATAAAGLSLTAGVMQGRAAQMSALTSGHVVVPFGPALLTLGCGLAAFAVATIARAGVQRWPLIPAGAVLAVGVGLAVVIDVALHADSISASNLVILL